MKNGVSSLSAVLVVALASAVVHAEVFHDSLVQAPKLRGPERGTVAGTLSGFSLSAPDLVRGEFSLPSALDVPDERGSLLAKVFPTYSPHAGLTEWGLGWETRLCITRDRDVGDIRYDDEDGYVSPWGRLVRGTDDSWYVQGFASATRLTEQSSEWVAVDEAGTEFRFTEVVTGGTGTYQWCLTEVETVVGGRTVLSYDANESGRVFLSTVLYGASGYEKSHRVEFLYDDLPLGFVSYRSHSPKVLDRRVREVVVSTANGDEFVERWRFTTTYEEPDHSPAFFLRTVTKTYAAGGIEPVLTYSYANQMPERTAAEFEHEPALDTYLFHAGYQGIQPNKVAFFDVEQDGIVEFEHHVRQTQIRREGDSFVFEALEEPDDTTHWCRPDPGYNDPRRIIRMLPGDDLHVVTTSYHQTTEDTYLMVCDFLGRQLSVSNYPGYWHLDDPNTRLVDLNADRKPDILRVWNHKYEVLENVSNEDGFGFEVRPAGGFDEAYVPLTSWVHDLNGDGLQDLVKKYSSGIVVHYGSGNLSFVSEAVFIPLVSVDGSWFSDMDSYGLTFFDANKDGLADIMVTRVGRAHLLLNHMNAFRETSVTALQTIGWDLSNPVVLDIRATGNDEIVYVADEQAHALALNGPETNLLTAADDGKGTVVRFDYARSRPQPGLSHRLSVLRGTTVHVSGYDEVSFEYRYGDPALHSVGWHFVGFGHVEVDSPLLSTASSFLHSDDFVGVPADSVSFDARYPDLRKVEYRAYDTREYLGVAWLRLREASSGWTDASGDEEALETTSHVTYERERCPVEVIHASVHGAFTESRSLSDPADLQNAWHCLHTGTTLFNDDPLLGFDMTEEVTRNDAGRITHIYHRSADEVLLRQEIEYDEHGRLAAVDDSATGRTTVTYSQDTGLLESVLGPTGVHVAVDEREDVTDRVRKLITDRGGEDNYEQSFRFDGFERLAKHWHSFGGSHQDSPLEELVYSFATSTTPGAVTSVRSVSDAASRTVVDLLGADDGEIAQAQLFEHGWLLPNAVQRLLSEGRVRHMTHRVLSVLDEATTYDDLIDDGVLLSEQVNNGFGSLIEGMQTVQQAVERTESVVHVLADDAIVSTQTENDSDELVTASAADAKDRPLWYKNQLGETTSFARDAQGRLVGVTLPDGTAHSVRYDGLGRIARIERDGVGSIDYSYEPGTGRLAQKTFAGTTGIVERTEAYAYDAAGRVTETVHTHAATGESSIFQFTYDGEHTSPATPGQIGLLSRVMGDKYERTTVYNPDGSVATSVWRLADWREVAVAKTYFPGGDIESTQRVVRDLESDSVIDETTQEFVYDTWGRLHQHWINGELAITYVYGTDGLVERVDVAGRGSITYSYDPVTKRQSAYVRTASEGASSGVEWFYGNRGLVERENMLWTEDAVSRVLQYDERAYLATSTDDRNGTPFDTTEYTYSASGVPETVGYDDVYVHDDLGRVVQKGDRLFTYGPQGMLSESHRESAGEGAGGVLDGDTPRGGDAAEKAKSKTEIWSGVEKNQTASAATQTLRFYYDEAGNRVFKERGGDPVAGYIDGGYLTADRFVEPLKVLGRCIGLLEGGEVLLLDTDPRGTLLADSNGTPRLASPYGERATRPDLSAVIDFVEKGFDSDLGTVRVGVRDFDTDSWRWMTPDPLFMERPEKCIASPVECNLYSYAKNNPIAFVDPTGLSSVDIHVKRTYENDKRTLGVITVSSSADPKTVITYSLELPDRGNKNDISRINKGTYSAIRGTSEKFGDVIRLEDKNGRTDVLMHSGNTTKHTKGCILPGASQGEDAVWNSRKAQRAIIKYVDSIIAADNRNGETTTIKVHVHGTNIDSSHVTSAPRDSGHVMRSRSIPDIDTSIPVSEHQEPW